MQRGNAKGMPDGQTGKIPVADVTINPLLLCNIRAKPTAQLLRN